MLIRYIYELFANVIYLNIIIIQIININQSVFCKKQASIAMRDRLNKIITASKFN